MERGGREIKQERVNSRRCQDDDEENILVHR